MSNVVKGWQRVVFIILPYFIVVGFFQFLGFIFSGVEYEKMTSLTSKELLIISLFNTIGTFIVLWFFMKNVDEEAFVNLGFSTKNRFKDFLLGIVVGLIIISASFFLMIILNEITFQYKILVFSELIMSILAFTIISIAEEMFFRGYILRNLMISFNKSLALVISSFIFAIFHSLNPNINLIGFLCILVGGFLLGISYIYTKNLWFPIALHFIWNLFQSLAGFNVSGQDFYSLIEIKIENSNWINGGSFGLEGSIISILIQIFFIFVIIFYFRKKTVSNKIFKLFCFF